MNKMTTKNYRTAIASLLLLAVIPMGPGCGTWIGNPDDKEKPSTQTSTNAVVELKLQGSDPTLSLLDALSIPVIDASGKSAGTLQLQQAYIALSTIKIKGKTSSSEFKGGPYVVDLVSNTTSPDLGTVQVTDLAVTSMEFKLAKLETEHFKGTLPSNNISNKSIYLKGTYVSASGTSRPFTMSSEFDEEFSTATSSSKGKEIALADGTNAVIMAFRLGKWFDFSNKKLNEKGLDFSSISGSGIDVSEKSENETAKKLAEIIKETVKYSARFGKDSDGDGKLATSEDDDH